STSQSMTMVFSPSALVSTTARSARPIRREISCVRPPMRPFTLSRSLRLLVARGSIAYSAVTQPLPFPVSHRGTPLVNEAVHSTLVPPKLMRAEPSACALQPRSIVTSRSWSGVRPSARTMSDMGSLRVGWAGLRRFGGLGQFRELRKSDDAGLHVLHITHLGAHEPVGEGGELRCGRAGGLVDVLRPGLRRSE